MLKRREGTANNTLTYHCDDYDFDDDDDSAERGNFDLHAIVIAIVSTIINTEPYKSNNGSDGDGY